MHFKSLLHVRDHVKVQGRPYELLTYIALHINMHTGEAFELTIERQAQRHQITPEWTRILLNGLIATGELVVERSRGRHPNRYRFPLERCHACQGTTPEGASEGDDLNPEVPLGVDFNPKLPPPQPQTEPQTLAPSTPNSAPANPKLTEGATALGAQIPPLKEVKDLKEEKDAATPNCDHAHVDRQNDAPAAPLADAPDKAETASPFYCAACGYSIPTCVHRTRYAPEARPTRPRGRVDAKETIR
jgi:hypothetical protein